MGKDVMVMDRGEGGSSINVGRVITGGLLAGLVINISETILNVFVVAADMEATLKERNLPPVGMTPIIGFIVFGFLLGIATVWLYAAMRPRLGPGVRTAAITGVVVWLLAYAYSGFGMTFMGFFPAGLMTFALAWGLVEVVVGAVAGAWVYRE
jgi:hypothetical protein